jgi:hypothetical protein
VGDNYDIQEVMADNDERDAGALQADATTLRTDAGADHAQAAAIEGMGLPGEAQVLELTGTLLDAEAAGLDGRAALLHQSAGLEREAADLFRARDAATDGAKAAELHAEGAQVVLDYVDMNEQDRTRWLGEQGAATGEAAALHVRADDLTNQGIDKDHEAGADRNAARDGLPGRPWSGTGHPSNASSSAPAKPSEAE